MRADEAISVLKRKAVVDLHRFWHFGRVQAKPQMHTAPMSSTAWLCGAAAAVTQRKRQVCDHTTIVLNYKKQMHMNTMYCQTFANHPLPLT